MSKKLKLEPLKMSNEAKHEVRKLIVRLHKQGKTTREICDLIGAKIRHVQMTLKNWREGGAAGISAHKTGRPKGSNGVLTPKQESEIRSIIIDKNPNQLRFKGFLWDRKNIRSLIWEKYKIQIVLSTLGYYLSRWGFTAQRPAIRSYMQNSRAVKEWVEKKYPAIKKQAKKEGGDIYWSDETGIQNETNYIKGYAPIGKTPILLANSNPKVRVNMVSAITNQGKLRFMFYRDKMNQHRFMEFIIRLVKSNDGRKVFLILDNLSVHHGKLLHKWLAERKKKVEVFFLPAYSPEYNPDEYLNGNLKREMAKLPAAKTADKLEANARGIVKGFQRKPKHIASYFKNKFIRYAA